jgi:hypothetical protein
VAKSKGKAKAIRCYCGTKIRPGDKRCKNPRCGRVTKAGFNAGLRKAVAAAPGPSFTGKSAQAATAWCPVGHPNRPGGNCCTTCGQAMPGVLVPPMGLVGKSAFATEYWRRELGNSPDPGLRELVQKMLYPEGGS